jgi:hypothetical protein
MFNCRYAAEDRTLRSASSGKNQHHQPFDSAKNFITICKILRVAGTAKPLGMETIDYKYFGLAQEVQYLVARLLFDIESPTLTGAFRGALKE